jgi:hypothetical protein
MNCSIRITIRALQRAFQVKSKVKGNRVIMEVCIRSSYENTDGNIYE